MSPEAEMTILKYKSMSQAERAADFGYSDSEGLVYFARGGGLYRIGFTADIEGRAASMQAMSPVVIEFVQSIPGNRRLRNFLHALFDADRQHADWFKDSDPLQMLVQAEDPIRALEDLIEDRLHILIEVK